MPARKAARILGAKKEVTEKDAKQAAPLVRYWGGRLRKEKNSDNWRVFAIGAILGVIIGILIGTL